MVVAAASILGSGGVPAVIGYLAEVASFSLAFMLLGALALLFTLLLRLRSRSEPKHRI